MRSAWNLQCEPRNCILYAECGEYYPSAIHLQTIESCISGVICTS
jgi:hypothetical protein